MTTQLHALLERVTQAQAALIEAHERRDTEIRQLKQQLAEAMEELRTFKFPRVLSYNTPVILEGNELTAEEN